MSFVENWAYRKRFPWWLKYQVRQAVRRKLISPGFETGKMTQHKALAILKNDRRFEDLLDHCGADVKRDYLYCEPYNHKLPDIPRWASELAEILECRWEIQEGQNQWHPETIRVAFCLDRF